MHICISIFIYIDICVDIIYVVPPEKMDACKILLTGRYTHTCTHPPIHRSIDPCKHKHTHTQTYKHTNKHKHKYKHTNIQSTYILTDRHTDIHTNWGFLKW